MKNLFLLLLLLTSTLLYAGKTDVADSDLDEEQKNTTPHPPSPAVFPSDPLQPQQRGQYIDREGKRMLYRATLYLSTPHISILGKINILNITRTFAAYYLKCNSDMTEEEAILKAQARYEFLIKISQRREHQYRRLPLP